jgi:DNA-binding transcriptional MerR regulator
LENRIMISDFVKLTGSTLKTIKYYHKIDLLPEPARSSGGYRLYGPAELTRMQLIKRLKSLGLDLTRIKEILGDIDNPRTLREVLQSLRTELLNEKKTLEERVAKIEKLLSEDTEDAVLLDDFQWGQDYREKFLSLAEYFKTHPEKYQMALEMARRLARLDQLSEDDPEVEALARESAEIMKSMPLLEGANQSLSKAMESLYNGMVAGVLSPARMKHKRLVEQYLTEGSGFNGQRD